jgi:undecaprenyl-diphosphatase
MLLLGGIGVLLLIVATVTLASVVLAGDTQQFDRWVLVSLRDPADLARPIGPAWLRGAALDITALGSATVLGLTVAAVAGFLLLHREWRTAVFVTLAASGGWVVNAAIKALVQRPRPDVVPHLREVMTLSFPSGHALTSAVVYLTLGALLMRVVRTRLAKIYCLSVSCVATALIGISRVYLGVHYPTDVLAGWLVGFAWALGCWLLERSIERRAGLLRERAQAAN